MEGNPSELIPVLQSRALARRRFLGGLHVGINIGSDDGALIRSCQERNVEMKSQRCLGGITGDRQHSRGHAAKSSAAQAQCLRTIRSKHSRARDRQRQTAAKLTTFMAGIRRFIKAYAILWQKLYARFSEHTLGQCNRVLGSHAVTHLEIFVIVFRCASQIPNRPIERSTCYPNLWACHRHVPLSNVTK
jgi:hypothetical protein